MKRDQQRQQNSVAALTGQARGISGLEQRGGSGCNDQSRSASKPCRWIRCELGDSNARPGARAAGRRGTALSAGGEGRGEGSRRAGRAQFGVYLIHKRNIRMEMLNRQLDTRVSISRSGPG